MSSQELLFDSMSSLPSSQVCVWSSLRGAPGRTFPGFPQPNPGGPAFVGGVEGAQQGGGLWFLAPVPARVPDGPKEVSLGPRVSLWRALANSFSFPGPLLPWARWTNPHLAEGAFLMGSACMCRHPVAAFPHCSCNGSPPRWELGGKWVSNGGGWGRVLTISESRALIG